MKELSIKEKAEAYVYAVNKAKELILNENGVVRVDKPLFDELFPSEMEESEDEKIRKGLIEYFKDFRLGTFAYLEPKKIIAWLERQGEKKHQYKSRPRYVGEDELLGANKQGEQKPWSEEDKRNLNWVINVWNRLRRGGDAQTTPSQMEYLENFLKSLKGRVGCEVNCTTTWKPSDAQIGALEHFVRSITESGFASPYDSNTKLVYSLFNDLKKLREE